MAAMRAALLMIVVKEDIITVMGGTKDSFPSFKRWQTLSAAPPTLIVSSQSTVPVLRNLRDVTITVIGGA